MTSFLMDYDAFKRLRPMAPGEDEKKWRHRVTQDGLVRFTTRAVMRDRVMYQEIMAAADAADCPVVIVPNALPQFATRDYAPKQPADVEAWWHMMNGTGDKTVTVSRADARDVRLVAQRRREAEIEGRPFAIATEPDDEPKSEYDDKYIDITPEMRANPRLHAEAIARATSEKKFLRYRSGLAR